MKNITDDAELKKAVNNYINRPHIKPLVEDAMANRAQAGVGANDGQIIHAVLSWNPHNLTPGPPNRVDDPGSALDTPILIWQTSDYQNQIRNINTLEGLGELQDCQPVTYENSTNSTDFQVSPPPQPPPPSSP